MCWNCYWQLLSELDRVGESRGRKLMQSTAKVPRTTLFKKKIKIYTLHATVCSDFYGLCNFCLFNCVLLLLFSLTLYFNITSLRGKGIL